MVSGFNSLTVGYLLKSPDEHPVFEQKIEGKPKDILLRKGEIHIECKSFSGSAASSKVLEELVRFGKTSSIDLDNSDGFTIQYGVITSIPGWPPNPSFSVNEYWRFVQKGIQGKLRQLLLNKCNLIAFNGDLFVGEIKKFRETLNALLQDHKQISGLLVIRREHKLSEDPYRMLGSAYAMELIANQQAEVTVPADLLQPLTPRVRKISLRS
jgi:hypothetical protein